LCWAWLLDQPLLVRIQGKTKLVIAIWPFHVPCASSRSSVLRTLRYPPLDLSNLNYLWYALVHSTCLHDHDVPPGPLSVLARFDYDLPTGVYKELIRLHKEEGLSFKKVVTFNLDEYYPMKKGSLSSLRFLCPSYGE
jgi:hypothetical protein